MHAAAVPTVLACLAIPSSSGATFPTVWSGTRTVAVASIPSRQFVAEQWLAPTLVRTEARSAPVQSSFFTSNSQKIAMLRDSTGLTASQIGRLFGVSRRSVNNWLAGRPMAPDHEESLALIVTAVRELPGDSPDEKRLALFDSSSGASLFHRLAHAKPGSVVLQVPGGVEQL